MLACSQAVDYVQYDKPSPIQMASIPLGLKQLDVIGVAETGSGKTAAFVIPMLCYIMRQPVMDESNYAGVLAFMAATAGCWFLHAVDGVGNITLFVCMTFRITWVMPEWCPHAASLLGDICAQPHLLPLSLSPPLSLCRRPVCCGACAHA
jgi:hypothetical protein